MLFIRIVNYIRGYLNIKVSGGFTERFINICSHRGLQLWDICAEDGAFTAAMRVKDFFRVREIASVTRTKVRIIRRCGLYFTLKRYRHRWPAAAGVLLAVLIVYYTSSHIMGIDITGNSRIPTGQLLSELREVGVYVGGSISGLSADRIRNEMIINNDDIAWLGVNIRGSRVYIEITERIDIDSLPRLSDEPCNLVASKDGVIARLEIKQGQTMVKKGDAVREGDVLASGIMDSVYGGFRTVHAYGDVIAQTEYVKTREYPLKYTEKEYSGEPKVRYGLNIMGKRLDIIPRTSDESSDEQCEDYTLKFSIFGHDIEVGAVKKTIREYTEVEKQSTVSETVKRGVSELTEEVEKEIPEGAEIVGKSSDHNILSGETVSVTVRYECHENIAKESIIDKSLIDKNQVLDYDIESGE